jgi:MoaA/NifB/PqqE/SkfB family radical SAM enzyme
MSAFFRRGVRALHWECWSKCNLTCPFCYRTYSEPLIGDEARKLVAIVATSGAKLIVFAGGDPSLRSDLPELCKLAKELGLEVEVQTNAHSRRATVLSALPYCDSIAVSIDAPVAARHDQIRGAPGNFRRVMDLIAKANRSRVPVRVRSVVTNLVSEDWQRLGQDLSKYDNIIEWRLQELSPVGHGLRVQSKIAAPFLQIAVLAESLAKQFPGLRCSYSSSASKVSLYAMIRSDGQLYGTEGELDSEGYYPLVGSLFRDHLSRLAMELGIDIARHSARYA